MIHRKTQISVITDNRPGTLARITRALRVRGVNILGLAAWGETDHGVVRMIVDEPMAALHLLGEHGMIATRQRVLAVDLPNRPGTMNKVAALLGRKRVNVDYLYGSEGDGETIVYLKVDELRKAEEALKGSALLRKKKSTRK